MRATALAANPVSDTTDIAYLLEEPNVSLAANTIAFAYCSPTPQTVVVTMTNSAGPARNFTLDSNLEGQPFTVGPASWLELQPRHGCFLLHGQWGCFTQTQ